MKKYHYIGGIRHAQTPIGCLPGVTSILDKTKPEGVKIALQRWRDRIGHDEADKISKDATDRGTLFHSEVEDILDGKEVLEFKSPLTEQVLPILAKIERVHSIERHVYHRLGYQGSVDLHPTIEGKNLVLDWKTAGATSAMANPSKRKERVKDYYLQVAAYIKAINQLDGTNIKEGLIVVAIEGKKKPVTFEMDESLVEESWQQFLIRLEEFNSIYGGDF